MYKLEDIVQELLAKKPIKQIARVQRVSKNTVKKYRNIVEEILRENPQHENDLESVMQEFRTFRKKERYSENHGWIDRNRTTIEKLSSECSNYVRLYEVLKEKGFKGSYSSLLRYILKNNSQADKPVFRIETAPGEIAQVDFGYAGRIPDRETGEYIKAYVFVMVLCYSRDAYFEIVKSQDIKTWCRCHVHAFEHFGGTPKVIIPDNLKSAVIKAAYCEPIANKSYADLARHYGFQIDPCLPGTPEHKGKVESGVKYVKNNFFPLRTFADFLDANRQLKEWNRNTARKRIHGTTRQKPEELFTRHEKDALIKLPIDRFEISVWKRLKVYRDLHIQFDKAYYSVPYHHRGKYVDARKTDSQLAVFYENRLIAVHIPVGKGKRQTNKDHYPAEIGQYMEYDTDYCIREAFKVGPAVQKIINALLKDGAIRNLRSAQNIIRLKKKYGPDRLEAACDRAVRYGNYTYGGIKNILEKELERQQESFLEQSTLDSSYARDLNTIINQEKSYGNLRAN